MTRWLTAIVLSAVACVPSSGLAQWYAAADFMPLIRSDSSETVFQRNQAEILDSSGAGTGVFTVGSQTLLSSNDLELGFIAAGRLTVGNRLGMFGVEASCLVSDTWRSGATLTDANGHMAAPFSQFGGAPDPSLDNNTAVTLAYRTQLASAELHLTDTVYTGPNGVATLLAGVRVMAIDERLSYLSVNATTTNDFLTDVDNRLIGPQVGMQTEFPFPGGLVSIGLKGALLYNSVDKTLVLNGTRYDSQTGEACLLGEVGIAYWFFPTSNLAVRVGYELLALSDIGLATDNLVQPTFTSVSTGSVLYQAPYIGVMLTY